MNEAAVAVWMRYIVVFPFIRTKNYQLAVFTNEISFVGIVCSAYSPIGAPNRPAMFQDPSHPILLENDVIKSIAEKHKASPAQVRIVLSDWIICNVPW